MFFWDNYQFLVLTAVKGCLCNYIYWHEYFRFRRILVKHWTKFANQLKHWKVKTSEKVKVIKLEPNNQGVQRCAGVHWATLNLLPDVKLAWPPRKTSQHQIAILLAWKMWPPPSTSPWDNHRLTRGLLPRKVLSNVSFIYTYSTADPDNPPPRYLWNCV